LFLCVLFYFFQRGCAGGLADLGCGSPPIDASHAAIPPAPHSSCRCTEYLSRILDLEGRLSLMKRQTKTTMNQASKSYGVMKQVSILEDKVSCLVAQVMHLEECDSFLITFIESACEQLKSKFPAGHLEILAATFAFHVLMNLRLPGTCLHPADENRRVAE
jgi:hypothetical protein